MPASAPIPTSIDTRLDASPGGCSEWAGVRRRGFLAGALALSGATTLLGSAVLTAAPASAVSARSVLLVLSLRGAADGMSLVVPHGDPVYYRARPTIGVPAAQLLGSDAMFGLHPQLGPLMGLWNSGRMAVVHATGSSAANRSHFAAMEEVEDAAPGSTSRVGWLNRLIGQEPGTSALQGFNLGSGVVPASLVGPEPVMSGSKVADLGFAGTDGSAREGRLRSLHSMWDADPSPYGEGLRSAFAAVDDLAPVRATGSGTSYPSGDLGDALAAAARLVRGDVGVEVMTVDHGAWDMHADLGNLSYGHLRSKADELARGLAAFFADLGSQADKVTVVTISEFGRRVVENSSAGLDHGHGNAMMVLGAGVRGGYYGRWPGLSLGDDADLTVTTDYRDVLADVVAARFAGASLPTVFPGLLRSPVGLMT